MRAITILQPWASLIVHGEKLIETRGWSTNYRGSLAIHAAVRPLRFDVGLWNLSRFGLALRRHDIWYLDQLPLGKVVGTVTLADCIDVTVHPLGLEQQEATFGDYSHGRYAWMLTDAIAFLKPISAVGKQRFWTFDAASGG